MGQDSTSEDDLNILRAVVQADCLVTVTDDDMRQACYRLAKAKLVRSQMMMVVRDGKQRLTCAYEATAAGRKRAAPSSSLAATQGEGIHD